MSFIPEGDVYRLITQNRKGYFDAQKGVIPMGSISARFAAYMDMGKEIDTQLLRLAELEAAAGNTGSASFDSVGRAAGSHADRTGRLAAVIVDLETQIREMVAEETAERRELEKILSVTSGGRFLLKPDEKAVLRCRFFDRITLEETAEVLGISVSSCKNYAKDAFRKLEEKYNGSEV